MLRLLLTYEVYLEFLLLMENLLLIIQYDLVTNVEKLKVYFISGMHSVYLEMS